MTNGLSPITSLSFNQDFSCLAVGYEHSYKVFNCDPFGECFNKDDEGGAKSMEMLFSTSLIAIVGLGDKPSNSSRKLKIINTKRKSVICELTFPTSVLFVKLNRKRLLVVLLDQLFIYDVSCMKLLHTIEANVTTMGKIVADLSSSDDSILAFTQSSTNTASSSSNIHSPALTSDEMMHNTKSGSVVLFNALNIQPINIIECHKSPLQKIALSKDGFLLATASLKGTIIRVFRTTDGKKVYEFRRGSYSAIISSLSFNMDNTILSCSSNTGTIHFFKLDSNPKAPLPTQLTERSDETTVASDDRNVLDIPHQTIITDEDNLEINKLINDQMNKNNKYSSNFIKSGINSTGSIKSFIWNRSKNYLPSQINSMLEPKRDFAYIKLQHEVESVVAVVGNNCFAATYSGDFMVYNIPPASHSEKKRSSSLGSPSDTSTNCILLKQYRLND